ncbi:MAG TPA: hypothetical protein VGJ84_14040 [Polyangiaceae bacterium]|jgi:hypothetical protein
MSIEMESVKTLEQLGFHWKALDPFLFCVHHEDAYPAGNDRLGTSRIAAC